MIVVLSVGELLKQTPKVFLGMRLHALQGRVRVSRVISIFFVSIGGPPC